MIVVDEVLLTIDSEDPSRDHVVAVLPAEKVRQSRSIVIPVTEADHVIVIVSCCEPFALSTVPNQTACRRTVPWLSLAGVNPCVQVEQLPPEIPVGWMVVETTATRSTRTSPTAATAAIARVVGAVEVVDDREPTAVFAN